MPGAERTLTEAELNRAVLARQLLLERRSLSLPKALERVGGIQAQYAPAMYVGLWSRVEGLEREALTRALERRKVVQGTLLRGTIHLVSPADWWTFSTAVREPRRESWLRGHKHDPSAKTMAAAARRLRPRLAGEPIARADLQEEIGAGPQGMSGINMWLDLVRTPPSGTWDRRRADLFYLAEAWIGPDPEPALAAARAGLVRSYLRAFGPASVAEIASWAGLGLRMVSAALADLELRRFRAEDGEELVDLPRQPLPDPDTPAPVRFLPTWDASLLVHARRAQLLPEEHRSKVFNPRTPHSVATFLVDGRVAGAWREEKGKIKLEPFGRLTKTARRQVEAESQRLADFVAA